MTDQEIDLLRALCRSDNMAYLPQESSTTALREFDALVAVLRQWKKAGWIQLEVVRSDRTVEGYRRKYRAAAARCTDRGREALRRLGEGSSGRRA